jgi:hypothetical protein
MRCLGKGLLRDVKVGLDEKELSSPLSIGLIYAASLSVL